jgi:hypothetical protein
MPLREDGIVRKQAHLLVVIVFVAGAGCGGGRARPVAYNNVLAVNNFYLAESARNFRTSLTPLSQGAPADLGAVRNAYDAMKKELDKAKDELAKNRPPRLSGRAWRLHYLYQDFLAGQEKILNGQFRQVLDVVDERPPRSPEEQWAAISPLLDEAAEEEKKTREPLLEAQKSFARLYNSNLEQLPTTQEKTTQPGKGPGGP